MKLSAKMLLPALGLPLLLAACGSASTPEGTVKFNDLKTSYKDSAGNYVSCDNVTKQDGTTGPQTTVGVYYSASGTINSVDISLQGATATSPDSYYTGSVSNSKLQSAGGTGNYKTLFYADAGHPLPLAITINPNPSVAIQVVNPSNKLGSFYANLTINTASGSAKTTSRLVLTNVQVYGNCTITNSNTGQTL